MLLLHATDAQMLRQRVCPHNNSQAVCATRRCMHCTATAVQIWACWAAQKMTLSSVSNCNTVVVGYMF